MPSALRTEGTQRQVVVNMRVQSYAASDRFPVVQLKSWTERSRSSNRPPPGRLAPPVPLPELPTCCVSFQLLLLRTIFQLLSTRVNAGSARAPETPNCVTVGPSPRTTNSVLPLPPSVMKPPIITF